MAKEEDRARYDFKRALEEIRNLTGRGTELISLYIPPNRQIHEAVAYLRDEYSQSSNIKSKGTRKNVMSAIDSIMSKLRYYKTPPPNGLVIFVGHIPTGGDQTTMVSYVLEPPEPINTYLYRCDSNFYLEPLEAMLREKEVYGLLVIDRSEATIGLLKGSKIHVITNIQSRVPSKHGRGGQSARRFERLIEIAAHEFFKKVGDMASEAFLAEPDLKGILIGGPGYTKDFFLGQNYLHHELMKKVIDTFDVGYTDEYGLRELVENSKEALAGLTLMKEKKLIQRLLEQIRRADGGLAAYGEDDVRRALEMGAVDILLVSEDLREYRIHMHCPNCGNDVQETVKRIPNPKDFVCSECGSAMELVEKMDAIDELYEMADSTGTTVELISGDSEEGELLMKAFGGIAALLRYKL